jgi:hypothetical protein
VVEPKPKKPGMLSLRLPIHFYGSFRNPEFEVEKGPLTLRAGAALALALVNPFAALIPLIETGPGEDSDCSDVFKSVAAASGQAAAGTGKRK